MAPLLVKNNPFGITQYDDPSQWPLISGQVQWNNKNFNPNDDDMWHTHLEFATNGKPPGFPVWAIVGDQDITIPVTLQIREVNGITGQVNDGDIHGEYANHIAFAVTMDQPGPYKSIGPDKVAVYTGKCTINLGPASRADTTGLVPPHGWTGISIKCRTTLSNSESFDNETVVALYSAVDTTVPESPINEAGIPLMAKAINVKQFGQQAGSVWGIHLTEIRDQSVPIIGEFEAPSFERVNGYNYGQDPEFQKICQFLYTATLDQNMHVIPPIMGVTLPSQPFGQIGNFDTLDPLFMSKNPPLPGNAPNEHVLILAWDGIIPMEGFTNQYGQKEPGGGHLRSVLKLITFLGPNPQPAPPLVLTPVPEVHGQTLETATAWLEGAGFRIGNVGYNDVTKDHPDFPPGLVWYQEPSASAQGLPQGTLVNLGIAIKGTPPVQVVVPNVVGMTQSAAQTTLQGAGLALGTVDLTVSPALPGTVLTQSPVAGTSVNAGTAVSLSVATAAPTLVIVPNLVGMTVPTASAVLGTVGLVLSGQTTTNSPTVPKDQIISQNPVAGAQVLPGSQVSVLVSLGPVTPPENKVLGTIEKRPDGTICVCSPGGTPTQEGDVPCLILGNQ